MPRDIPIGNGSLLILYDRTGLIRDLCFPSVGSENHAQGHVFRVGAWVNGAFSWLDDAGWERSLDYEDDTLVARIELVNRTLGVEILMRDVVDFHENLYVRELTARNLSTQFIDLRLFFHHDFHIYGTEIGDTVCYKPEEKALLHYKGRRYFLVNVLTEDGIGISQFAAGLKETKGLQGTWVDAEDGVLSGNPVAQGSVDSICAVHTTIHPGKKSTAYYWMAACVDWRGVKRLNDLVVQRTPGYFIKRTADYWRLWLNREGMQFGDLPGAIKGLYTRSLLILRTHISSNGAIIASDDSDILHFSRDTYAYVWPRDGALVAHALDLAGFPGPARSFFEFCGNIVERKGFFMHKYTPDGSLASSWHPWVFEGRPHLPIQEDETGLVLWALWEHFSMYRDVEFVKPLYRRLIKAAADFMCEFVDQRTGLPLPSYDLWEEQLGVHTFTVCAVIAGLNGASRFTAAFGEMDLSEKYHKASNRMSDALAEYLYDGDTGRFLVSVSERLGILKKDFRLDSSLAGLIAFDVFSAGDERVVRTMNALKDRLWCKTGIGGMSRYENDRYQSVVEPNKEINGNPWVICTLWYAQYQIARAKHKEELQESLATMNWVAERALPSGVFAEQVNPFTGEPVSVSPLTWSHAAFIIVVQQYLKRAQEMEKCPSCGQSFFFTT
ncbi:MAG TPA: glycoside hydrolase family 15 protein [Thermodesulfovibrionales bacterium]|nr:glycoside hydrolase family 15 protein [Thermodesulfovibrionales bacterium]